MEARPLAPDIVFTWGLLPVSRAVLTTWITMVATAFTLALIFRVKAPRIRSAICLLVTLMADQIRQIVNRDPWPFMPVLGSLFVFILLANMTAIVPAASAPTSHIETPAALALVVLLSVHLEGIRTQGPSRYLKHYFAPTPLMMPLNVLTEVTRTFSLMIRLFGNIMSHEFVIAIVLSLAGLLVPVPFMLLGILIGIIQAYIFTVLAAVYMGAAVGSVEA